MENINIYIYCLFPDVFLVPLQTRGRAMDQIKVAGGWRIRESLIQHLSLSVLTQHLFQSLFARRQEAGCKGKNNKSIAQPQLKNHFLKEKQTNSSLFYLQSTYSQFILTNCHSLWNGF